MTSTTTTAANWVRLLMSVLCALWIAPSADADFTLTGTFQYRDRAFNYNGFLPSEPALPIRSARVLVLDASTSATITETVTDASGNVSVVVPGTGTRDVLVRARSESSLFGSFRVRAETMASVLYTVSSSTFNGWDQNTDLDFGTVVSEKISSGGAVGNPFNMLDQGIAALEYIQSGGAGDLTGTVRIQWPGPGGSFTQGFTASMYVGDGYDDVVQLHELAHVFHNMFSDSDSPGGVHVVSDSDQDPRQSYSEGWANFFPAAVRQYQGFSNPSYFIDIAGPPGGGITLRFRLEDATPWASSTAGEADEISVACVLWDIVDTDSTYGGSDDDGLNGSLTFAGGISGDEMLWSTFTGPVALADGLTINDHWNAFFVPTDYGNYAELLSVFLGFGIRNVANGSEPDNTLGSATPYTSFGNWTAIKSLYYSASSPPAPGGGDSDFYSFDLALGQAFRAETRYPNGSSEARTYADTYLRVFRPNGTLFSQNDFGGGGRNAAVAGAADVAGTWSAEVTTIHPFRRTGSYEFRVELTAPGPSVVITDLTPSSIAAASMTPQQLTMSGSGFADTTDLTIDGVSLTPGVDYSVVGDNLIALTVPGLTQTGTVDVVVSTLFDSDQTTLQVDEVSSPLLVAPPAAIQAQGITLVSASRILDWTWVAVSVFNTPTVFPGLFSLDIGNNAAQLAVVWKPFILTPGYATKTFGPLSDLAGVTVYWQSFVLEASGGYDPPWPSSNSSSTAILF